MSALKKYVHRTKEYPGFERTDFKWSEANSEQFLRLAIRVRDELVAFGNPGELKVDENGVVGGGVHLRPKQVD